MFDAAIIPVQRRLLARPARVLAGLGVRADWITLAGFAVGVGAVAAVASGAYLLGLVGLLINRLADGLDGEVARVQGATERGAFLDIALDFFFYALFPVGFALADPGQNALPAAILLAGFAGTGSSFLAFALVAEKRNLVAANYPTKGIYYLGGLTEGAETIAVFVAMCVFPAAFPWLALGFAAACLVTTATRWTAAWTLFRY